MGTYHALDHVNAEHRTGQSLAQQALLAIRANISRENGASNENNETLRETLRSEELFDAFMVQLFNEYCAECLLSVIELNQFKERLYEENERMDVEEEPMELYKTLTQSLIVYGVVDDYMAIAKQLYKKYIRVGSEWEINIDFGNRKRYELLFENGSDDSLSVEEMYELFDPCIGAMINLMGSAFGRFKKSKKYKMIRQHLNAAPSYEWYKR